MMMHSVPPDQDDNLDTFTVVELRDQLRILRLKVSGRKSELIERLRHAYYVESVPLDALETFDSRRRIGDSMSSAKALSSVDVKASPKDARPASSRRKSATPEIEDSDASCFLDESTDTESTTSKSVSSEEMSKFYHSRPTERTIVVGAEGAVVTDSAAPAAAPTPAPRRLLRRTAQEQCSLFSRPLFTMRLALLEGIEVVAHTLTRWWTLSLVALGVAMWLWMDHLPEVHREAMRELEDVVRYALYWLVWGILSSAGFGFGVHSFVLYLAPYIFWTVQILDNGCAQENLDWEYEGYLAGYRPYCVVEDTNTTASDVPEQAAAVTARCSSLLRLNPSTVVTLYELFRLVQVPCLLWGIGTSIGELPPYFMARAARLAGEALEDVDEEAAQAASHSKPANNASPHGKSLLQTVQDGFNSLLGAPSFLTILGLASFPNPLFDLAGMTCGYALTPFMTFFMATMIGKGLIKAQIQGVFVIFVARKELLRSVLAFMKNSLSLPYTDVIQSKVDTFTQTLRHGRQTHAAASRSLFQRVLDIFIVVLLLSMVVNLVHAAAQRRYIREKEREMDNEKKNI